MNTDDLELIKRSLEERVLIADKTGRVFNSRGEEIGYTNPNGYRACTIRSPIEYRGQPTSERRRCNPYIHQVIWLAFGSADIPEGHSINHKDGNKSNNSIENLEIVTYSENNRHKYSLKPKDLNEIEHIGLEGRSALISMLSAFENIDLDYLAKSIRVSKKKLERILK